ncbi:Putative endonuclease [Tenacibaculum discolor]
MNKELEGYEKWLISHDKKKESTAKNYKDAIPKLEDHYKQFSGRTFNLLNLSIPELKPIIEDYKQEGKYASFGDTSNGTYRNSLSALLRYKEWQQNNLNLPILLKIKSLLQTRHFQKLLTQEDFYFQKLTDLYQEYKAFDTTLINQEVANIANTINHKNFNFQKLLDTSEGTLKEYLLLLGKMIAIFDEKGYNKQLWNPYEDKRNISRAMFRQNLWTKYFLEYKIDDFSTDFLNKTPDAFKYSIKYILAPETNLNIVSKSHRDDIITYFELKSDDQLITLFSNELKNLYNPKNKGVIISSLLYNSDIKKEWLRDIIGLMAADGSGWLPNFSRQSSNFEHSIIWNHRAPSGTSNTIKALRKIIENGDTFNIYITSNGFLNYVATVIDFAENKTTYLEKNWKEKYGEIYEYQSLFENYIDGSKKASIVFLCSEVNKVNPISDNEFDIYGNYSKPRQGNLTPIQSAPEIQIKEIENDTIQEDNKKVKEMKESTNQILYGPPGTGKTYETKKLAVDTVLGKADRSREEILKKYNELVEKEQIVFTTFHQSMSYEDFVEGIKPKTEDNQVIYEVEDGIFKRLVTEASYSIAQEVNHDSILKTLDFSALYDTYLDTISEKLENEDNVSLQTKSGGKVYVVDISPQGNFLLAHKNGTRRYTVSKDRLLKLNKGIPDLNTVSNVHNEFRNVIGGSNASVYWAVLNQLQQLNNQSRIPLKEKTISHQEKANIVSSLVKSDYKKGSGTPYVLIIDEINRGNVSAIFGELITLLEPDKRLGQPEAITVKLPYSKTEFGVPHNLHIIGTMNTADRSVEALDTALRRRFEFTEVMPKPELLEKIIFIEDELIFNLKEVLETINNRIEVLIDRDHTIGHSYFINIKGGDTEALANTFNNKVIPLLQEYFYGDYGKIGLVLGNGFVEQKNNGKIKFAKFSYQNQEDLKTPSFLLKKITPENIIKAISETLGLPKEKKENEQKEVLTEAMETL